MLVIRVILFTLRIVEVFGSYWHPHQHMSWNDVIGETHVNSGIHGDVYVVDLFDHRGIIPELLGYTLKTFTYQGEGKKKVAWDEACTSLYIYVVFLKNVIYMLIF